MTYTFTPAIWIHLVAAVSALALGAAVFIARKGTFMHRMAGRTWAALMVVTAVSTYWIRANGSFSWIHLLSVLTLAGIAGAIYYAVTGNIRGHRMTVIGLYIGGLLIAGAFSFLPERRLGQMLWSSLGLI